MPEGPFLGILLIYTRRQHRMHHTLDHGFTCHPKEGAVMVPPPPKKPSISVRHQPVITDDGQAR